MDNLRTKASYSHVKMNITKVQEVNLDQMLVYMYNYEILDVNSSEKGLSEED